MNNQKINRLKKGNVFTFDVPFIMSIKKSPKEEQSLLCEHQYGEKYAFKNETDNHMFFVVYKNGKELDCKWIIEKETNILYVSIISEWELYIPGEYVIKFI